MLHFSNQELAESYHVSVRTVRNWIEAAKLGKLELTLHEQGKRSYVANTSKNLLVIEKLVVNGKKYRPRRAHKLLEPRPEFYQIYSEPQIHDIVSNLEIHHEIPPDYNYFAEGATSWDQYANRLAQEENLNALSATVKLLSANINYIDQLLSSYKYVNIIDIGVGNALPAKEFVKHLLGQGKLKRYVAIDISSSMLEIAKRNMHDWFDGQVTFEGYEFNFNYDRFTDILSDEYIKKESKDTINVILFLGGTLGNLRSPEGALRVIHDSMGANDILIYEKKLDSANTRKLFDIDAGPGEPTLSSIYSFVVNLLSIDKSLYSVEFGYDEVRHERYERIRFNIALTIHFRFQGGERLINLNKNDTILIWRAKQQSALDVIHQFDQNDFYTLQSSQTTDQEYILSVSRIKRE